MDWGYLAKYGDHLEDVVNTVMNLFWFHKRWTIVDLMSEC